MQWRWGVAEMPRPSPTILALQPPRSPRLLKLHLTVNVREFKRPAENPRASEPIWKQVPRSPRPPQTRGMLADGL
eukprot:2050642-Alexandrium_andersonii.AAC.1